jgi:hypothetical protein
LQAKTDATRPVLHSWPGKLAHGPNTARATCWRLQKRCPKVLLPSCCAKLSWATLYLADKNRRHAPSSAFPARKACTRAEQSIEHLLALQKHCWSLLSKVCCVRYRVSAYPIPPDLAAAKKKIHRQIRADLSSAMRSFDQGIRSVWRCCCENKCREHIFSKTHTNEFCGK